MPQTGWLLNNRNSLLTAPEAGSPRSRRQQTQLCLQDGSLQLFIVSHLLPGSSCGRRGEGAFWDLFYKALSPIHEGSTP